MPNALPLLLLGGAAAAVALGGKKKRKGTGGDIPLDKPIQVKKDGLVVNSGRSPVPPAVKEAPLEPFADVSQVQEALIATGKKIKADGKWGKKSQGALDEFQAEKGFKKEAKAHLATPDSLRSLHKVAHAATDAGVLADVRTGIGTMLWCDITKLNCPPDHECVPLFGPGEEPPGWRDVGICVPTKMIEAGYIPEPQAYAPGGFNRVVFSPDYETVTIGKGWKFQTLEPWLYKRMKAGKLLTYALEGSLAWEDALINQPKAFWGATLASVGLATAGATTKRWNDLQKSLFKAREIEVWATKTITSADYNGPGMYSNDWPPKLSQQAWADEVGFKEVGRTKKNAVTGMPSATLETPGHFVKNKTPGRPQTVFQVDVHQVAPGKYKAVLRAKRTLPDAVDGFATGGYRSMDIGDIPGVRETVREFSASSMDDAVKFAGQWADSSVPKPIRLTQKYTFRTQRAVQHLAGTTTEIVPRSATVKERVRAIGVPIVVVVVTAGLVYGASQLARSIADRQRDAIAESALLAWKDFAEAHVVRVGDKKVRIDQLPETVAVQHFQAYVMKQIVRFQMSTYE